MKISELAERSAVSIHRLRRYEQLGLIVARRTSSGYREFADDAVREAVFIAMSRDLGFSLKEIAETLPRYRARTLTFDQLIALMKKRIEQVDKEIAVQRGVRQKLVEHIAWVKARQREIAKRSTAKQRSGSRSASTWSTGGRKS